MGVPKFIIRLAKRSLIRKLRREKFRDVIVSKLNKHFDLKGKDEKDERVILNKAYRDVVDLLEVVVSSL